MNALRSRAWKGSLAAILLFLSRQPVLGQFEGEIESKNSTTDETGAPQQFTMSIWIKQDRIRVQISAIGSEPGSTIIYRNDRHVAWMLNDEERTYFEVTQEQKRESPNQPSDAGKEEKPTVRRSGKKHKILGYQCEQILFTSNDAHTEIWGTKNLGTLSTALSQAWGDGEGGSEWADELTKMGIFPLSASTRVEGIVVESSEVTKIERRQLSPELFELPNGYTKQGVPELMENEARRKKTP